MRIRALVFEDNEGMRELIREVLDSREYEVFAFSHPGQCPLHVVKACPCPLEEACADIIISDVQMPHVSGLEFVEGQREKGCRVRNIALMSAAWTEADLRVAEKHGYRTFHKPFPLSEMLDWLDECEAGIDPNVKADSLSEDEISRLAGIIDRHYMIEGQLRRAETQNVQRLMSIGCYRGVRHRRGLPVHGQRTRTNARTRKGRKKTVKGKKRVGK